MVEREPMTQSMTISEVQKDFGPLVKRVSRLETRLVVEENGRLVAALVSTEDLEDLKRLDRYRKDPWQVIDEIHARNQDKDPNEVEEDVAEAIEEMRLEERQKRERSANPIFVRFSTRISSFQALWLHWAIPRGFWWRLEEPHLK